MWNLLNGLSIMMSLSLLSFPVPGVASMIQSIILQTIYLDILQADDWLTPFFQSFNVDSDGNSLTDQGLNQYFENSGFSSVHMLINLGSTTIYVLVFLGLMIGHAVFKTIAFKFSRKSKENWVSKIRDWLGQKLYWSSLLRFIIQQFYAILLSALINLYDVRSIRV